MLSSHQSVYQRFHSIETALLHLLSDRTATVEAGNLFLRALLDMSTTFDMVDHEILLVQLDKTFWNPQDALKFD